MISRLAHTLRTRGLKATGIFILSRLLRIRDHLVFCSDGASALPSVTWTSNESVFEATNASDLDELIKRGARLPDDTDEYLNDVRNRRAIGLFIFVDGQLAHWAFMMKESRTLCYLGFKCHSAALLGAAFTVPRFRGRGLQTRSVMQRIALAHRHGYRLAVSETAPDNEYSQRALKSGGMTCCGRIRIWIIINHFVIRWEYTPKRSISLDYCR